MGREAWQKEVRMTADTNVLVRAILADEPKQAQAAQSALEKAELIAVTPATLCEFVWVLARGYGVPRESIGKAIRVLLESANVEANRPAIEAGLAILDAGGDFADGVIAFEGAGLGADTFVSFDKDAVKQLKQQGQNAVLLA